MLPDYAGGSLVNLMASLVHACGGTPAHPRLKDVSFEKARNIILLIIDGLGDRLLMQRAAGGELARRRRGTLTSVFPSTTASAITTSYTGRTPLEHGLTGWFTYFGEAGCVAVTDDGHPVATAMLMRRALEYTSMFEMPVIEHCEEQTLKGDGVAHEGFHACALGLRGIPGEAESITQLCTRDATDQGFRKRSTPSLPSARTARPSASRKFR